jgi:hypothetical protein
MSRGTRVLPVIAPSEMQAFHDELDVLLKALGGNDAEEAWWLIMDSVDTRSRQGIKEHLAVLLVIAMQRIKTQQESKVNGDNGNEVDEGDHADAAGVHAGSGEARP